MKPNCFHRAVLCCWLAAGWFVPTPSPAATRIADYYDQFQATNPTFGWIFQWNGGGPIGNDANYHFLAWDRGMQIYNVFGVLTLPPQAPGYLLLLGRNSARPGGGFAQAGTGGIERFALARYVVQAGQGGNLLVSFAAGTGAASTDGLHLQVYLDNQLVADAPGVFLHAASLPVTAQPGQIISVCLGGQGNDSGDTASLDWNLVRLAPGEEIVTRYQRDFSPTNQAGPWRLKWNAGGVIGRATNYAELLWDFGKNAYDADGGSNSTPAAPAAGVSLGQLGGLPGAGATQPGALVDRHAILEHEVAAAGDYELAGAIARRSTVGQVDVKIFVNDQPQPGFTLLAGSTLTTVIANAWHQRLTGLRRGDRIYAAIGPSGTNTGDSFAVDLSVLHRHQPELLRSTVTNGVVRLLCGTQPGRRYQLTASDTLTPPATWNRVGLPAQPTGATWEFTETPPAGTLSRFYRVELLP